MTSRLLVLASGSPRRADLLHSAGLDFIQIVPAVSESPDGIDSIEAVGEKLAERKALAVAQAFWRKSNSSLVLGADTTVLIGSHLLGKPRDESEARKMLETLSGKTHRVITGYCILSADGPSRSKSVTTEVTFKVLTPLEINFYLSTTEWRDKAGGYGIQGRAAFMVESLRGSYTNVVGLPLSHVLTDLEDLGLRPGQAVGQDVTGRREKRDDRVG